MALAAIRQAAGAAAGDELRALRLLEAFLLGERLARATAATAGKLAAARAAAVSWDGREVPARRLPALLAGEADPARRAGLEKVLAEAEARFHPFADEHRAALRRAAASLGYASFTALAEALRGEPASALAARAEATLAQTLLPYRVLLEDLGRRELSLPPASLRDRDVPRLLALAQEPAAFPPGHGADAALAPLRGLGLDLAAMPGVVLDLGARPGKDPRPLLLPVEVPGSIRVSAVPEGGAAGARALLRALGGAAYYASVRSPSLEFRRFGAPSADAWAGLFEELAGEPAWLAEATGLGDHHLDPLVKAAALRRLDAARDAAARVLFELARAREPERAAEQAARLCERALSRPCEPAETALLFGEPDPLLRSADALAAQLLSAQAEARLVRIAGPVWWRSEQAGAFLREAFAEGSRLSPEALSGALGFERLDAAALAALCRERGERAGVRFPARPGPGEPPVAR